MKPKNETDLLINPETLTFCDTSNCCEDCPDSRDNPPKESDCPYFEIGPLGWPICTREGNSDEVLSFHFPNNGAPGRSSVLGVSIEACQ